MAFHIVFSREIDLDAINRKADAGENPHHVMGLVARELGAAVHWPKDEKPTLLDRLRAKLLGPGPDIWAFARRLDRMLAPGDVVYCQGEDLGLPIAAASGGRGRARIVSMFHNIDRPRGRLGVRLLNLRKRMDIFFAVGKLQADYLRRALGLGEDRVRWIDDNTDTGFFSPGARTPERVRPLIMSVGLEQRDYRTLAAASADLDLDVRISGFSRDATAIARAFPETMPANMERRFYEWPELRQLYRDADIVVVSIAENDYGAGIQVVMEGLASGRPVIASRTRGLADFLDTVPVIQFEPGDVDALRAAIVATLADPDEAARRGAQGRAVALARLDQRHYAAALVGAMRELAG